MASTDESKPTMTSLSKVSENKQQSSSQNVPVITGGGFHKLFFANPSPSSSIDSANNAYSRFDTTPVNLLNIITASMKLAMASAMGQHHYEHLTSPHKISTTVDTAFSQIQHFIPGAAATNPRGIVVLAADKLSSTSYQELLALSCADTAHDDSTPAAADLLISTIRHQILAYEAEARRNVVVAEPSSCPGLLQTAYRELDQALLLLGGKQLGGGGGGGEKLEALLTMSCTEVAVYDTEELRRGLGQWKKTFEAMLHDHYYRDLVK